VSTTFAAVLFAVLAAVSYALLGFFSKLATREGVQPIPLAFFSTVVNLAVIAVCFGVTRGAALPAGRALLYVAAAGLAGAGGMVFFARAIRDGDIALVVPICGAYPAIAVLLGAVFLRETLSPTRALGVLLVVGGVFLVTR
jgi:uncharacterized membrane protein